MGFGHDIYLTFSTQIGPGLVFKKLADVTLSEAGELDSGTFEAASFLKVVCYFGTPTGNCIPRIRVNNLSSSIYGSKYSEDGAAFVNSVNDSTIETQGTTGNDTGLLTFECHNLDGQDKGGHGELTRVTNASIVNKSTFSMAVNLSDQITRIKVYPSVNDFPAGSRLIVLGL